MLTVKYFLKVKAIKERPHIRQTVQTRFQKKSKRAIEQVHHLATFFKLKQQQQKYNQKSHTRNFILIKTLLILMKRIFGVIGINYSNLM